MGEPFADLYAEHLLAARRVARALAGDGAAEDIAQEAFTRVLARQRAGGGPDGAFRPYLLAAVRNLARDHLAERRRIDPQPLDPRAVRVPGAGELVTAAEETAMTRRAYESLPARWRAVLWQTEVEGHTPAELAPAAGMTPNGVAQLAARARVGLAAAWQRERGTQERITGPAPALVRLAEKKRRKALDTSQADPLCSKSQGRGTGKVETSGHGQAGPASDAGAGAPRVAAGHCQAGAGEGVPRSTSSARSGPGSGQPAWHNSTETWARDPLTRGVSGAVSQPELERLRVRA